ncbi:hypothetical protein LINGRAHAP2_LOCUS14183 [Linum grandiflorum]
MLPIQLKKQASDVGMATIKPLQVEIITVAYPGHLLLADLPVPMGSLSFICSSRDTQVILYTYYRLHLKKFLNLWLAVQFSSTRGSNSDAFTFTTEASLFIIRLKH